MSEPPIVVRASDLGDVALKFAGLYLLWCGLITLPPLFIAATATPDLDRPGLALASAGYGATFFLLAFVLIRWSAPLSARLFAASAGVALPIPLPGDLQVVAFRVMGIYVLASSLPTLVQWVVEMAQASSSSGLAPLVAGTSVQVALGVALMLYRSSWRAQVWKALGPLSDPSNGGDATQ